MNASKEVFMSKYIFYSWYGEPKTKFFEYRTKKNDGIQWWNSKKKKVWNHKKNISHFKCY